jgi:hypothetical protein
MLVSEIAPNINQGRKPNRAYLNCEINHLSNFDEAGMEPEDSILSLVWLRALMNTSSVATAEDA